MSLSPEDREALLTPCGCGHTINDHGSLVACWRCDDENGECATDFEDLLTERIEAIVARQITAALTEVADAIEATAAANVSPEVARYAYLDAARIVRAAIPPP